MDEFLGDFQDLDLVGDDLHAEEASDKRPTCSGCLRWDIALNQKSNWIKMQLQAESDLKQHNLFNVMWLKFWLK
jgi:hypothetical protein